VLEKLENIVSTESIISKPVDKIFSWLKGPHKQLETMFNLTLESFLDRPPIRPVVTEGHLGTVRAQNFVLPRKNLFLNI